ITNGWQWTDESRQLWQQNFGKYHPLNFGIGSERTQHLIWRIDNGELAMAPKVIVILIGTNNIGVNSPEEVARGIEYITAICRNECNCKILLMGIFPRGKDAKEEAVARQRREIEQVNTMLSRIPSKLFDEGHIRFLDLKDKFLQENGTISSDL